jgi:hypothetical protein
MTKLIVAFCNHVNAPKNSVPTSKRTQTVSTSNIKQSKSFAKIIGVQCENHRQLTNTACGQNEKVLNVTAGSVYIYNYD